MKWFSSLIRLAAKEPDWMKHLDPDKQQKVRDEGLLEEPQGNFGRPLYKRVEPKPRIQPPPMGTPVQPRKPSSPKQMNLPMDNMPPEVSKHNNPNINPFYDLENDDNGLRKFASVPPIDRKAVGKGMRGAQFHYYGNAATSNPYAVAKSDANSALSEGLVHHIDRHLGLNVVPKTVVRGYEIPSDDSSDGKDRWASDKGTIYPHSVQQFKPGENLFYTPGGSRLKSQHPDFPKIAFLDYLVGNHDRHDGNVIYDNNNSKMHAIDNGGAFRYTDDDINPSQYYPGLEADKGRIDRNLRSLSHNFDIDPSFRNGILNADDDYLHGLFQRVAKSPHSKPGKDYPNYMKNVDDEDMDMTNFQYPHNGFLGGNINPIDPMRAHMHFNNRLHRLQNHLRDPGVRTYRDLADVLRDNEDVNEESGHLEQYENN